MKILGLITTRKTCLQAQIVILGFEKKLKSIWSHITATKRLTLKCSGPPNDKKANFLPLKGCMARYGNLAYGFPAKNSQIV